MDTDPDFGFSNTVHSISEYCEICLRVTPQPLCNRFLGNLGRSCGMYSTKSLKMVFLQISVEICVEFGYELNVSPCRMLT